MAIPDSFDPSYFRKRGTLESILDWIDRPGQVVRNLLTGNPEGAARQGADFLLELVDAPLPGDIIPMMSRPQDNVRPSSLVGMDDEDPWYARLPVDIALGIATDPISYLTFGGSGAAKGIARGLRTLTTTPGAMTDDALRAVASSGLKRGAKKAAQRGGVAPGAAAVDEVVGEAQALKALPPRPKVTVKKPRTEADRAKREAEQAAVKSWEQQRDDIIRGIEERVAARPEFSPGGIGLGIPFRDPAVTLVPGSQVANATAALGAGIVGIPVVGAMATALGRTAEDVRMVMGIPDLDPAAQYIAARARGAASASTAANLEEAKRAVSGLGDDEANAIGAAFQRIRQDDAGRWVNVQANSVAEALAQDPRFMALAPDRQQAVLDAVGRIQTLNRTQLDELRRTGALADERILETTVEGIDEAEMMARRSGVYGAAVGKSYAHPKYGQVTVASTPNVESRIAITLPDGQTRRVSATKFFREVNDPDFLAIDEAARPTTRMVDPADPDNYMMRMFRTDGELVADDIERLSGSPSVLKGRRVTDVAEFLNSGEGRDIVLDARRLVAERASIQGRAVGQAYARKAVIGDSPVGSLFSAKGKEAFSDAIGRIAETDRNFASLLQTLGEGLPPRGKFTSALATLNRQFKKAAVYGIAVPRFAGIFGNRMSGPLQILFGANDPAAAVKSLATMPLDLGDALAEGAHHALGLELPQGALRRSIRSIEQALKNSGGDYTAALNTLRADDATKHLAEAIELNVLSGFVSTEDLMRDLGQTWLPRMLQRMGASPEAAQRAIGIMDMPGAMFQAVEDHMRLGLFLDYRAKGMDAGEAARLVSDSFLDYGVQSAGNRALRDVIPFWAFTGGSIRQSLGGLMATPAIGAGFAQVIGQNDDVALPPFLAEQAAFVAGEDAEGNPLAVGSLRLPIEALNSLPNASADPLDFGRSIQRSMMGSSQPLLKLFSNMITGRDPYFDTPAFSYDRTPELLQAMGVPERSEVGRVYNIAADTGLIQPLETAMNSVDTLLDDRLTGGQRALKSLTGIRLVSIDEDMAIQQQINQFLSRNPAVRQYSAPYLAQDADPEGPEALLLRARREAMQRSRERRQAQQ